MLSKESTSLAPVESSSLHEEKSIDKDDALVSQHEVTADGYPTDDERATLRRIVRTLLPHALAPPTSISHAIPLQAGTIPWTGELLRNPRMSRTDTARLLQPSLLQA